MADSNLSQDEINALLSDAEGVDADGGDDLAGLDSSSDSDNELTQAESGQLEKIADSLSRAHSSSVSTLTSQEVNIKKQVTGVKGLSDAISQQQGDVVVVSIAYTAPVSGNMFFIFKNEDAKTFSGMASGSEVTELDEMANSAIQETLNNMAGGADTQLGSDFGLNLSNNAPKIAEGSAPDNVPMIPDGNYYTIDYNLSADNEISFNYSVLITIPLAKAMVSGNASSDSGGQDADDLDSLLGGDDSVDTGDVDVQDAKFSQLTETTEPEQSGNMELLLDVPMGLTVELGRATKTIQEILSLGEGSIIELDKLAGEPVEILVNGKAIAKGEVVVIDENFGVRVTDIINLNKSKLLKSGD